MHLDDGGDRDRSALLAVHIRKAYRVSIGRPEVSQVVNDNRAVGMRHFVSGFTWGYTTGRVRQGGTHAKTVLPAPAGYLHVNITAQV